MGDNGIPAARAMLADLETRLRRAASGEVVNRAAEKVQEQIDAVSKRILSKHVATGHALAENVATRAGGLVQLNTPLYITFALGAEWPFRSGMPPFVLRRAIKIFEGELLAAINGQPSPIEVAESAATAAEFKKAIIKIYRSTPEGKAKRRADRKAALVAGTKGGKT